MKFWNPLPKKTDSKKVKFAKLYFLYRGFKWFTKFVRLGGSINT